jgi:ATP-dependent Clp protease ATP-binding subunit ClpC
MKSKVKSEIERAFNPEFLNRIDDTIVFHPLSREQIGEIVHIMLKDLHKRLGDEELHITLTDSAISFLVDRGYDENFGARPLRRAIQRYIEDPLSEKILMGEFAAGDEIMVDIATQGEMLDFQVPSSTKT